MRFNFKASNNVTEYKTLLAGLRLAKEMQIRRLLVNSDSQLILSQINGSFVSKDSSMATYLKLVVGLIPHFEKFELIQIPRVKNAYANALSKLVNNKDS